jgi:hypothetical protein
MPLLPERQELAEAVSKRIKKSFVTIISPHVYEKTVVFQILSPLNCIIKALIG